MILIAIMQLLVSTEISRAGLSKLFSRKVEIANMLDFVGHVVSFAAI